MDSGSLAGSIDLYELIMESVKRTMQNLVELFRYRRTIRYLLRQKGVRAAYNFIVVKLFIFEGEGSMGFLFSLFINPLRILLPQIASYLAPYPYNIEVEITTRCNKKCIICEHTYWNEPNRDLTFEEFKKIVEQLPKLKWINLTGEGDAFLNKDYLKMIRYLKSKDIPVYLVDSFDLIDEKIAKELIEMGVDGIYVSIDAATEETYEKIKVGCKFERTIGNIKKLIELRKRMNSPIPEICFRFVINKLNIHEMPHFIEFARSFGSKEDLGDGSKVEFAGLLVFDEVKHLFVSEVPREILQATMRRAKELGFRITFSHTGVLPPIKYCIHWFEPYIMMGGYVLPCCAVLQNNNREFLRKYSFGNILNENFRDIWHSDRYKKFRKMVPRSKGAVPIFCAGCRTHDTSERRRRFGITLI